MSLDSVRICPSVWLLPLFRPQLQLQVECELIEKTVFPPVKIHPAEFGEVEQFKRVNSPIFTIEQNAFAEPPAHLLVGYILSDGPAGQFNCPDPPCLGVGIQGEKWILFFYRTIQLHPYWDFFVTKVFAQKLLPRIFVFVQTPFVPSENPKADLLPIFG